MDEERNEKEGERPRPRVVDKRVSANPSPAPEEPAAQTEPTPAPEPERQTDPAPEPAHTETRVDPSGQVWTPEQEAEARRMAQEIAATPSIEWVVNTAVSLANIAATKLDLGNPADAGLAIDALSGILNSVGDRLEGVEQPLRQTLAQLQMAYAERVTNPPPAGDS